MIRLPSPWIILLCLLLFGFGELAGAMLGGYPQQIRDWTIRKTQAQPSVHGLTGIADIDRTILEGIGTEALARVHTFHLHAHGLALVVFVLSLIVVNMDLRVSARRVLLGLICLGLLYPFGWLAMAFALPFFGKGGAFRLAEKFFFVPFGGTFLATIWGTILVYFVKIVSPRNPKSTAERNDSP